MSISTTRAIGKYELLEQVSTTGVASIYRARDTTDHKVVALKVLHSYFVREETALQRYLQEMERVQALHHPNIVPIHGVLQDGPLTVVVMDFALGSSLKARKSTQLPLREVVSIIGQVAAALDYAHGQGLVHRNLRPANVFYDPQSGQALVSDFGIITLVEGGHPLLRSTVNTPSPSYTAPEQIQGQPPDPRNDVYSLGALAYELLTGVPPFEALSPYTVLSRQLTTTPDAPSALNQTLPGAVDDVLFKALKRRPEERHASCGETASALAQAAGSFAITSSAPAARRSEPPLGHADLQTPAMAEPHAHVVTEPQAPAEGRVICSLCGSGNTATAVRCATCWGILSTQPVLTPEEERQWLRRYAGRLRLRKRLLWGTTGAMLLALVGLWVFNLIDVRPPLPPAETSISSQSAANEWSMAQRDLLHTGFVPGPAFTPTGKIQNIFQSDGPILAAPAMAGDTLYVATSDRRIVALNKDSGQILGTYPVSGPVNSSPTVAGDMVFVGLRDGTLLALDAATLAHVWSYHTTNPIYGSATVRDGVVYIGSGDHFLYALDAQTGGLRWKRETGDWIFASPTVNQEIAVVGSQDGELYMVDVSNGTLRYQVNMGSTIDRAATVVGDVVYFTTRGGYVLAMDYTEKDRSFRKAGTWFRTQLYIWDVISTPPNLPGRVWSRRLRETSVADLATADGRLYLATVSGRLRALDAKTGQDLWKVERLPRLYSSPVVSGDTVIQAASDGTIYGFNAATGEERWRISVKEGITTSLILAGGTLYVPTTAGNLYAIQ